MKLLTEALRKQHFKYLGLGEYNNTNLRKLQKTYLRTKDVDGVYGPETDKLLRHLYNVKKCAPSFKPTEFRCTCGHCNGYPSYMKRVELRHLQKIRDHYDRPMIVTSGLRCKHANGSSTGSIQNSLHLVGRACDFYMAGVTDTLANRKKAIKWIKTLPNHHYTYGNGINSVGSGVSVYAPYMGNALHTDVNKEPKKAVDPLQKWYDEMKVQFNWSKNQNYKFVTPTVASSKKNGTCITFPAVSLQRLGLLPKGKYFYFHPQHKRISGSGAEYVKDHPDIFKLFYPNKTVKQLGDKLQKGDIIGFGNPAYHTMIYMGMKNGKPIYNTMGHKKGLGVFYPSYANRKINMVVRIKKVR